MVSQRERTFDVDGEVALRLKRAGQRYSTGRRALVDALRSINRPVTIPELVEATPGLAMSSAYRNLAVLEATGVVRRIVLGADDHARFELAEVLTEHHHHHLICMACGSVDDFTVPARLEKAVTDALAAVATATSFQPVDHRLDLVGTCASCTGN
ncbi:MAG TPA: transcriptional repressor [Acidimicrobiales bacterium]|nr:transcriptional repressor [Acidimicrobiales bacterium]